MKQKENSLTVASMKNGKLLISGHLLCTMVIEIIKNEISYFFNNKFNNKLLKQDKYEKDCIN
jgi:hypothetical protein